MTEKSAVTPLATSKEKPVKRHRLLKIMGIAFAVLVLVVVLLPYLIPTGWLAGKIEKAAESHIRGPVKMGGVSWGWLGGLKVENVTIGEPSEFGGGTFLKVSSVSAKVSLLDIVFSESIGPFGDGGLAGDTRCQERTGGVEFRETFCRRGREARGVGSVYGASRGIARI